MLVFIKIKIWLTGSGFIEVVHLSIYNHDKLLHTSWHHCKSNVFIFHETLTSNFYYAVLRITCATGLPSSTSNCSCRMSHKLSYGFIKWFNMVDTSFKEVSWWYMHFKEAKGHWMNFNLKILPIVHTKLSSFFCFLKSTLPFSLHLFLLACLFVYFNIIQFGKRIRYMKTLYNDYYNVHLN